MQEIFFCILSVLFIIIGLEDFALKTNVAILPKTVSLLSGVPDQGFLHIEIKPINIGSLFLEPYRMHIHIGETVGRGACGMDCAVFVGDGVFQLKLYPVEVNYLCIYNYSVVKAERQLVLTAAGKHRVQYPSVLDLGEGHSRFTNTVDTGFLEPADIVGVVDYPHSVGLVISCLEFVRSYCHSKSPL